MFRPMDVPPELQHLIEKRVLAIRRARKRRKPDDRRTVDLGPYALAEDGGVLVAIERRSGNNRRQAADRRTRVRRKPK